MHVVSAKTKHVVHISVKMHTSFHERVAELNQRVQVAESAPLVLVAARLVRTRHTLCTQDEATCAAHMHTKDSGPGFRCCRLNTPTRKVSAGAHNPPCRLPSVN